MNCREFNNLICDYLENELSHKLGKDMQVHMGECQICRELYLRKLNLREELESALCSPEVQFTSQSTSILRKIDRGRYGRSITSTLKIHFNKYWMKYISAAAMIAALVVIIPRVSEYIRKQNQPSSPTQNSVHENLPNQNSLILQGDKSMEILTGEQEKSDLMDVMKKQPASAVPWRIVHAGPYTAVIYNYSHLLYYRKMDNIYALVSAVNIQKLNLGYMQGSSIIDITSSPSGQYYILGSSGMPEDPVNKSIYLLDLEGNQSKLLGEEKLSNMVLGWSNNSRFFVIANKDGKKIKIYDFSFERDYEINFGKCKIESIGVSDNGNIYVVSATPKVPFTSLVYILKSGNYERPQEIPSEGETIGFNENGVVYYSLGTVYEKNTIGKRKVLKNLGDDFKIQQKSAYPNRNCTVFGSKDGIKVYDIVSNNFYDFKVTPKESEHYTFSSDYSYLATDDGRLINRSGKTLEIPPEIMLGSNPVLFENEIVYVDSSGGNSLGDFEIVSFIVSNNGRTFTIKRR